MSGGDVERDKPAPRGTRRGNSVQYAVIHQCSLNIYPPL